MLLDTPSPGGSPCATGPASVDRGLLLPERSGCAPSRPRLGALMIIAPCSTRASRAAEERRHLRANNHRPIVDAAHISRWDRLGVDVGAGSERPHVGRASRCLGINLQAHHLNQGVDLDQFAAPCQGQSGDFLQLRIARGQGKSRLGSTRTNSGPTPIASRGRPWRVSVPVSLPAPAHRAFPRRISPDFGVRSAAHPGVSLSVSASVTSAIKSFRRGRICSSAILIC